MIIHAVLQQFTDSYFRFQKQRRGEQQGNRAEQFKGAEQSRGGHTFGFGRRPWGLGLRLREMTAGEGTGRRGVGRRGGPSRLRCGEDDKLGGDRGGVEEDEVGTDWRAGRSVGAGGSCFPAERSVAWQRNSVARGFGTHTRPYPSHARGNFPPAPTCPARALAGRRVIFCARWETRADSSRFRAA